LQRLRLQPNPAPRRDEFRFARVAEFDRLKLLRRDSLFLDQIGGLLERHGAIVVAMDH
jgi:hypothetical protein